MILSLSLPLTSPVLLGAKLRLTIAGRRLRVTVIAYTPTRMLVSHR